MLKLYDTEVSGNVYKVRLMLSLLGLDHKKLTYFFNGRDFRLTDVAGDNNFASRLLS